jgi:hypothetical protein
MTNQTISRLSHTIIVQRKNEKKSHVSTRVDKALFTRKVGY